MPGSLFLSFVALASAVAFFRPRIGFHLLVLVACLQDPLRKITAGTPALMAISGLPVWLATCVGALRADPQLWRRFKRAYPRLSVLTGWFLLCLIPPVLIVFSYGLGVWQMALLGSFAYLAPLITMVVGFSYVRDLSQAQGFLRFYAVTVAAALVGTAFEYLGAETPLVGTSAMGTTWLRFSHGTAPIRLMTGFFRSPDIMGWHAAMLIMICLSFALAPGIRLLRMAWLSMASWGLFCVMVSGRRKMAFMPVIWAAFMLLTYTRAGRARAVIALLSGLGLVAGALLLVTGDDIISADYYSYAADTLADAPQRFSTGTLGALQFTLVQSGVLGRGIGTASQGAQHLQGGLDQGWQESGASKLLVELGLPGFVCALLLALGVIRGARLALARVRLATTSGIWIVSLFGILAANAASFGVSHQVYGDLTTVTLTAFIVGLALSGPRWAELPPSRPMPRASVPRAELAG